MKAILLLCSLFLFSCGTPEKKEPATFPAQEIARIEERISSLYAGLSRAYNGGSVNTDSLFDAYYEKDVRYVTAWGWTEPLDSTKSRLRNAVYHVKDFTYRIESMQVKPYSGVAYAFFVLRQNYRVDGSPLEEYLPTTLVLERHGPDWKIVHAHRSTDYETIRQYVAMQQKRENKK
ncbi:MAG: nuclear transport factor 2 family protein [Ignavibacteriales bacterium]|nr:nuclear transport factor 2 family protein [Ignavibacteriales bacterium]